MGRWRRSRRRVWWEASPPHSWGDGGEAAGGAGGKPLLPIHGEVAAKPPEGLVGNLSSPFMGRWRRSRRRGWWEASPPHSWGVAAKPPEGLVGSLSSPFMGGEAAGGAGGKPLLPIHGEVAAKPPEGHR